MAAPILISGAMDCEIDYFLEELAGSTHRQIHGFDFWQGSLQGLPVVVSQTRVGMVAAAIATAVGLSAYMPSAVINQGTAGGHRRDLKVGDIVIGRACVPINGLEMPAWSEGQGCAPLEWVPNHRTISHLSDRALCDLFASTPYTGGQKQLGVLGCGDLFSREMDRIDWLHATFGEDCEDMETYAVQQACQHFGVPFAGVRIISNNERTLDPYDRSTARTLQQFVCRALADWPAH